MNIRLKLYHKTNSRSQRILWLLEELHANYELIHCPDGSIQPSPHPLGKYPCLMIHSDDDSVQYIAESAAIAEFLSLQFHHFGLNAIAAHEVSQFLYWKNFSEATFMPELGLKQVFHQIVQRSPPLLHLFPRLLKYGFDRAYLNDSLRRQLQLIERQLEYNRWIAGSNLSIADILLWFPLHACIQAQPESIRQYSQIQRYLQQIENRTAFQQAMQKGRWSSSVFQSYWQNAW